MWSLVDALYLRPLPFPASDRIVAIHELHPERGRMAVAPANFLDWSRSVAAFSVVSGSQWIEVSLNGERDSQRVTGASVLPGFFDVWDLPPLLGRTIMTEDYDRSALVAVVGERLWRERLQADPRAVGAPVRIDGIAHTVIGVLPDASSSVGRVQIWVPWLLTPEERTERRYHLVGAIGRLRDGRSATEATSELQAQYARLGSAHADTTRDWSAAVPLDDRSVSRLRSP
jgi:hypothetical protein